MSTGFWTWLIYNHLVNATWYQDPVLITGDQIYTKDMMREMSVFMDGFENIPLDLKKKTWKKSGFFFKLEKYRL